ncbi:Heterokaryon incompatibility protein (HET) domain containing protein [Rhypophila sp. PSN 637]
MDTESNRGRSPLPRQNGAAMGRSSSEPARSSFHTFLLGSFPPYKYEALPGEKHSRLLKLISYNADAHALIGTLYDLNLSNEEGLRDPEGIVPYCALSYTWGSPIAEPWRERYPLPPRLIRPRLLLISPFEDMGQEVVDDMGLERPWKQIFQRENYLLELKISDSLSDVLVGSFDKFLTGELDDVPLLWVDAVCINQDDEAERAVQVNLMGDIYASAAETLIFLGPCLTDAGIFRWFHKTLLPGIKAMLAARKAREGMISGFMGLMDSTHVPKSEAQIEQECLDDLRMKDPTDPMTWRLLIDENSGISFDRFSWETNWLAYFEFFSKRAWFSRSWVVQEAVLSPSATIAVGDFWDVTWQEVGELSRLVKHLDLHAPVVGEAASKGYFPPDEPFRMFYGGSDVEHLRTEASSLVDMGTGPGNDYTTLKIWKDFIWASAMATRRRDATRVVDKIYSIAGLVRRLVPDELAGFVVDYRPTAREVFTAFTEQAIDRTGSLFVLAYVEDHLPRDRGEVDLPSWVPNFCVQQWGLPIQAFNMRLSQLGRLDGDHQAPRVCDGRLVVSGARVGGLRRLSNHPREIDVRRNLASCYIVLEAMEETYAPTGEGRVEAVWRTMAFNQSGLLDQHCPAKPRMMAGFRYFLLEGLALRVWELEDNLAKGGGSFALQEGWRLELRAIDRTISGLQGDSRSFPTMREIRVRAEEMRENSNAGKIEVLGVTAAKGLDSTVRREFYQSLAAKIGTRRMFLTVSGLIGICNWCSRITDELWLLYGGDVPYLLRPREDGTYTFVGACYVHGGMEGQLATDEVRGSVREIVIV